MGQTSPNIQTFASARGAAHKVYSIIDHVSSATFSLQCKHVHLFAAALLSVCITEHSPHTLVSRFDAANNLVGFCSNWKTCCVNEACRSLGSCCTVVTLHFLNLLWIYFQWVGSAPLAKNYYISNLSNILKQLFLKYHWKIRSDISFRNTGPLSGCSNIQHSKFA